VPPDRLDPASAAYYALIAISLVAVGALLTGDTTSFTIAERGSMLAGVVGVLGFVTWRARRRPPGDGE
jgi:hypothetical protein